MLPARDLRCCIGEKYIRTALGDSSLEAFSTVDEPLFDTATLPSLEGGNVGLGTDNQEELALFSSLEPSSNSFLPGSNEVGVGVGAETISSLPSDGLFDNSETPAFSAPEGSTSSETPLFNNIASLAESGLGGGGAVGTGGDALFSEDYQNNGGGGNVEQFWT